MKPQTQASAIMQAGIPHKVRVKFFRNSPYLIIYPDVSTNMFMYYPEQTFPG